MEEKNQGPVKIYSSKKGGIKKFAYERLLYMGASVFDKV